MEVEVEVEVERREEIWVTSSCERWRKTAFRRKVRPEDSWMREREESMVDLSSERMRLRRVIWDSLRVKRWIRLLERWVVRCSVFGG
jgi:hypothetical protein